MRYGIYQTQPVLHPAHLKLIFLLKLGFTMCHGNTPRSRINAPRPPLPLHLFFLKKNPTPLLLLGPPAYKFFGFSSLTPKKLDSVKRTLVLEIQ